MRLIRNIAVFCLIIITVQCAVLKKSVNKNTETLVEVVTNHGVMWIELSDKTPLHKANFIKLAEEGFYDSLLFHRVINGFMIQGGDPESRNAGQEKVLGNGGPGYTIPAEFDSSLFHVKGALAAARMSDSQNPEKASSGSQFYLVQGRGYSAQQLENMEQSMKRNDPEFSMTQVQKEAYMKSGGTAFLDNGYTVFGKVISGIEVIDAIAQVETKNKRIEDRPIADVWMKMTVHRMTPEEKSELLQTTEK